MSKLLSLIAKFLRSKFIHPKLSYKIWQLLCKLNHGQTFFFPLKSSGNFPILMYGGICGYSDGAIFFEPFEYEQESIPVYRSILSKSEIPVVIDVGANNGQSLMTVKVINPDTEIHCFEPFSQLTKFLNELVNINKFQAVHINNNILSDTLGVGKLFFVQNSTDTASTVNDFQSFYNQSLTVEKITLDSYCESHKINHISLIKIDVEGGELEVIKGAIKTLQKMKPDILIELLYTEKHYVRQQELVSILKDLGYRFYQIKGDNLVYHETVIPDKNYQFLNYFVTTEIQHENI